ncbi:hypothetical protein H0H93_004407 [Arthromyces matolae]|nr:hypothetical protein H0H93_004407 [Arthromyces matolae]
MFDMLIDVHNEGAFKQLPPKVFLILLGQLNIKDLAILSMTCRPLRRVCKAVALFRVEDVLQYFDIPMSFMDLLKDTGAVITGSAALAVINPGNFDPGDLDLCVGSGESGVSYCQPICSDKSIVNKDMAEVLITRLQVEYGMTPRTHTRSEAINYQPVAAVHSLQHGRFKLDIIESATFAMSPIFHFHSTAVMNAISPTSIFCAYPHLTMSYRNLANDSMSRRKPSGLKTRMEKLMKYEARGYRWSWSIGIWNDITQSRKLRKFNDPKLPRCSRDKGSLWFDFIDSSPGCAYRGPKDVWYLTM